MNRRTFFATVGGALTINKPTVPMAPIAYSIGKSLFVGGIETKLWVEAQGVYYYVLPDEPNTVYRVKA